MSCSNQKLLTTILTACAVFWLVAIFFVKALPGHKDMRAEVYQQPVQQETARPPFTQEYKDKKYLITPRFEYELSGLVVSSRDLKKTWFNIYYDRDPLNIKDACVIWGGNLAKDDFKKVQYQSTLWTCQVSFPGGSRMLPINKDELSNNHLLPATEEVAQTIRRVQTGDQVLLKGLLIDYSIGDAESGSRKTSITRGDQGKGACEVLFVESMKILRPANMVWRFVQNISWWLGWGCVVSKFILFIWSAGNEQDRLTRLG